MFVVFGVGAIHESPAGDHWSSVIYKGILVFCTGCRGRQPLPSWVVFLYFACRGGYFPPYVLRVAEDAAPYRFGVAFMVVENGALGVTGKMRWHFLAFFIKSIDIFI